MHFLSKSGTTDINQSRISSVWSHFEPRQRSHRDFSQRATCVNASQSKSRDHHINAQTHTHTRSLCATNTKNTSTLPNRVFYTNRTTLLYQKHNCKAPSAIALSVRFSFAHDQYVLTIVYTDFTFFDRFWTHVSLCPKTKYKLNPMIPLVFDLCTGELHIYNPRFVLTWPIAIAVQQALRERPIARSHRSRVYRYTRGDHFGCWFFFVGNMSIVERKIFVRSFAGGLNIHTLYSAVGKHMSIERVCIANMQNQLFANALAFLVIWWWIIALYLYVVFMFIQWVSAGIVWRRCGLKVYPLWMKYMV